MVLEDTSVFCIAGWRIEEDDSVWPSEEVYKVKYEKIHLLTKDGGTAKRHAEVYYGFVGNVDVMKIEDLGKKNDKKDKNEN
jgi:hypothetical protein